MSLSPEKEFLTRRNLGKLVVGASAAGMLSGIKSKEAVAQEKINLGPNIFPLKDGTGMHYAVEGLENYSYPQGYAVRGIMWEVYQQVGREHIWGPPESRPYIDEIGRICQPFQKGIFQLTTDKTQELLTLAKKNEKEPFKDYTWLDKYLSQNKLQLTKPPEWDNVFDKLSEPPPSNSLENIFGKIARERNWDFTPSPARNDWLEQKFIPKRMKFDYGIQNPAWEVIESTHFKLLERNQKIKAFYESNPQALDQYGLPVGYAEYPDVITVRFQRAAIHEWKKDLPWAKKGEVTVANAVLLVKEKTDGAIISTDALLVEQSDRFYDIWSVGQRIEGGTRAENQPPDVIGPEAFVQYWKRTFDFMQKNAQEFYKEAIQYVFTIKPADIQKGQGVGANYLIKTIYAQPVFEDTRLPDWFVEVWGVTLVHEANHIKVSLEGLNGSLKYGELSARKAEYEFLKKIGNSGEDALKWIVNIDDPKYQWWRR